MFDSGLWLGQRRLVHQHQFGQQHIQQGCQYQLSQPWTNVISSEYWSFDPHFSCFEGNEDWQEVTADTDYGIPDGHSHNDGKFKLHFVSGSVQETSSYFVYGGITLLCGINFWLIYFPFINIMTKLEIEDLEARRSRIFYFQNQNTPTPDRQGLDDQDERVQIEDEGLPPV